MGPLELDPTECEQVLYRDLKGSGGNLAPTGRGLPVSDPTFE